MLPLLLPLFLSEVLANEPGSVTTLEWIELAAVAEVDLSRCSLFVNERHVALPPGTLDTAAFLVLSRDTVRFEAHYGDSSGVWGDHPSEQYRLGQGDFTLANSAGALALRGPWGSDSFAYTTSAPDGVSFERIGDSLWQVTADPPGSTPGAVNDGVPPRFDWGLEAAGCEPPQPAAGSECHIWAQVANRGTEAGTTRVQLCARDGPVLDSAAVDGPPDFSATVRFAVPTRTGLNEYHLVLAADERADNNTWTVRFYTPGTPFVLSEIYAVPLGDEPEWLELYCTVDTTLVLDLFVLADARDQVSLPPCTLGLEATPYLIVTEDSTRFAGAYPGLRARVLEPDGWPSLNNDGDSLTVLLGGAVVDGTVYPGFGSRKGISLERVGTGLAWAFSVAASGSTPGAPNSVDVPYTDDIELTAAPNPFAPGWGEATTISFTVPFAAEGRLALFAGDGRHLRTLRPAAPLVSGSVVWDGRDTAGRLLPVGLYLLQLRLTRPREQTRLASVVIAR